MERPDTADHLTVCEARMKAAGLKPVVIDLFQHYFRQLTGGGSGVIREKDIEAVGNADVIPADELTSFAAAGEKACSKAVMIRLNGGLGTGMGLSRAKAFIAVKNGLRFLDIILAQSAADGARLALMNSFSTDADTRRWLEDKKPATMPLMFLQHQFPKVLQADFSPARWPADPGLEWNPPGHGDVYMALQTSGVLDKLLAEGIEYALIANSDNLGATLDAALLGYFAEKKRPFLMEVATRTRADKKGGHLARSPGGQLLLRESAQCAPEDEAAFQNIEKHRYFNTNNIWINLKALKKRLDDGGLRLPVIINPKTLDPRDPHSPPVYQIETAMGAAVSVFGNAGAVHVSRRRFMPVKKCSDLLVLRSDRYRLTDNYRLVASLPETDKIEIDLDPRFYTRIDDFDTRFADGVPSLVACHSLTLRGDITFGADVVLKGTVTLVNNTRTTRHIAAGSVLQDHHDH